MSRRWFSHLAVLILVSAGCEFDTGTVAGVDPPHGSPPGVAIDAILGTPEDAGGPLSPPRGNRDAPVGPSSDAGSALLDGPALDPDAPLGPDACTLGSAEPCMQTDGPPDGPQVPASCWERPFADFRFGRALDELNTMHYEEGPTLSDDGRTIGFSSNREGAGGDDLWIATRDDASQPFGAPANMTGLNSAGNERGPSLVLGQGRLYYSSNQFGSTDVFLAIFDEATMAYRIESLSQVSSTEEDISVTADALYGVMTRDGRPGIISRTSTSDAWTFVRDLPGISECSPDRCRSPFVSHDRLVVVIAYRSDPQGSFDLWGARRASPGEDFGVLEPFGEEVSRAGEHEYDPHVSADGCTLYWVSDRNGQFDLFVGER